ncbi:MAG: magnesium transporter, partial [Planctomycetia bacterium]
RPDVLYSRASEDVVVVAEKLAEYDLIALPIVDDDDRIVGIVTHDDVIDVLQQQATEESQRMGAVEPLEDTYLDTSLWQAIRKRVVWLYLLFFAEMFTSVVLTRHKEMLDAVIILVIFMPIITATGGNSGSQSASLVTRSLALGEIDLSDWWRVAVRELGSGLVLGLLVGILGALTAVVFHRNVPIALVLIMTLVSVTTVGSLVGGLMPLVFKRLGMDPAISSGPFVASMVDVLGISVYCTIASLILYGRIG